MLRVDRQGRRFTRLALKKLPDVGLLERGDIQQMIRQSADEFFAEMGERLLLLGEEVRPTDFVDDRIDLLALDTQGGVVVIELKRGNHKLHLLQALSYAGMVSKWEPSRVIDERARFAGVPAEIAQEQLEEFLGGEDIGAINRVQRVVLIAGDKFDYEVLITAEWLTEAHDLDIRCYRLEIAMDGSAEYLTCTTAYPPPELTEHASRRKRGSRVLGRRWSTWDEALSPIENQAVVQHFRAELAKNCPNNLAERELHYEIGGQRRFRMTARTEHAYTSQRGRFEGDVGFWVERLSGDADIQPVRGGRKLRFRLTTPADFSAFLDVVANIAPRLQFSDEADGTPRVEERAAE
jgi:hypothetical protein